MRPLRHAALVGGAILVATGARVAGGTGEYNLEWPVRGEILVYHSCGCADSCWVAEVRDAGTKVVKSRLRCDCEKLLFARPGRAVEQVVAQSCASVNDSASKPAAIRATMERLVQAPLGEARR